MTILEQNKIGDFDEWRYQMFQKSCRGGYYHVPYVAESTPLLNVSDFNTPIE